MKKFLAFSSDVFYRNLGRMSLTTVISSVLGLMFTALVNGDVAAQASGPEGFIGVFRWVTLPAFVIYLLINTLLLMRRLDKSRLEEPVDRWAFVCRELAAAAVCGVLTALPAAAVFAYLGVEGVIRRFMAVAFIFAPQSAGYFLLGGRLAPVVMAVLGYPVAAAVLLFGRIYRPKR